MKQLLWKEFREKRLWSIPMAASVVGVVALGQGYTYCGDFYTITGWIIPSIVAALLFGMGAYSGETAWGTADFLFSRPISWKKVLTAKLVFGIGVIAASAILGAVVYRVMCPAPYVRFAAFADLAEGVGIGMSIMLPAYLAGAACSVVFPGMVGAILTFVAIAVVSVGGLTLVQKVLGQGARLPFWLIPAWWVGAALAALLTARFGLTLSIGTRAKRYAVACVAAGAFLSAAYFVPFETWREKPQARDLRISPEGTHAIVREREYVEYAPFHWTPIKESCYFVRLSDMRRSRLCDVDRNGYDYMWGPDGQVYYVLTPPHARPAFESQVVIQQMDAGGVVREEAVRVGRAGLDVYCSLCRSSPDRKLAMVRCWHRGTRRSNHWLEFVDIENARNLDLVITNPKQSWWQSNTEVGYVDTEGKRRIVRVIE